MIPLPERLSIKLVAGLVCALLLALLIHDRNRWRAKSAHHAELAAAERATHAATVAQYRAAAERARATDAANAARVQAEQAAINERTAHDYESRIAAARARADELQREARAAAANPGSGGTAPVPGLSAAAQSASRTAGEDRLSRSDALIATEQAIQLDELIKWVREQAAIRPNAD